MSMWTTKLDYSVDFLWLVSSSGDFEIFRGQNSFDLCRLLLPLNRCFCNLVQNSLSLKLYVTNSDVTETLGELSKTGASF